ncbi:hypothetical protein NC653_010259 [Populus alba x Populus x berolinensis]|uniref:Uncharacterized protein n=1 Tax=Populus alba x Populus x berolinensis TaxID=444605 RepID=A0AAD6W520_9ROSI|nr:hypothetical protein NC653_010259 [Populus alba x Populus x berolinensis]
MAGSGHTSDNTNQDTKAAKSNQDSNLQDFSEDEENLIARMFGLVGKRLAWFTYLFHYMSAELLIF